MRILLSFLLYQLFGCDKDSFGPLSGKQPNSPDNNQCVIAIFDSKVTRSIVMRKGKQRPGQVYHWDSNEEPSNSGSDVLSYQRSEIVISYSFYFSDISSGDDELGRKSKGYNSIYNQYKRSFSPAGRSHFWQYSIRLRLNL